MFHQTGTARGENIKLKRLRLGARVSIHTQIMHYATLLSTPAFCASYSTLGPNCSCRVPRSTVICRFWAPDRAFVTVVSQRSRTRRRKALTRKPENTSMAQESGIKLRTWSPGVSLLEGGDPLLGLHSQ